MSETATFKVIIEDDEGRRSIVPIDLGEISIGRLDSNTIRLDERNVSRQHARVFKENGSVFAEDLDSYNGVWINGDRIKGRCEVKEGDLIKIGDFHLELRGEGLQRRSEETTQRTLLPSREAIPPESDASEGEAAEEQAPAPIFAAAPPPAPRREPPKAADDNVDRHEATAIIRLDSLELNAPRAQSSALAGEKAKMLCVSTHLAGRELEITKSEVVVGRTTDNDIVIDHRSVSRHHAKITVHGKRYMLADLNSANGTLVNGEAYAQTELRRGDLIELGHVKCRFVPPGESYTLTAEEQAVVRNSGAIPARARGVADEEETERDIGGGVSERRIPMTTVAIGGGVLVIILLLVALLTRGGDDGAKQVKEISLADPSDNPQVNALMPKVRAALAQQQWEQAATLGKAMLALESGNSVARELVQKATLEQAAQASYNAATEAISRGDWSAAWRSLKAIPESSVYAVQAGPLVERVRGASVAELVGRARELIERRIFDEAERVVDELGAIDAARPEVGQLRDEIASGRSKAAAGATVPKSKVTAPKPAPVPAPRAPAPAAPPKPTGGDPKTAYSDGIAALKASDINGAIEALTRCTQIDSNFALCHRALGIAYAKSGNGAKAARYYKQYLKVDPNAKDRDQVLKLLEQYDSAP